MGSMWHSTRQAAAGTDCARNTHACARKLLARDGEHGFLA